MHHEHGEEGRARSLGERFGTVTSLIPMLTAAVELTYQMKPLSGALYSHILSGVVPTLLDPGSVFGCFFVAGPLGLVVKAGLFL